MSYNKLVVIFFLVLFNEEGSIENKYSYLIFTYN